MRLLLLREASRSSGEVGALNKLSDLIIERGEAARALSGATGATDAEKWLATRLFAL